MCRRWSCVFPKEENRIGWDMTVVFWSNALLSRDESSWTGLAMHHFSVFVDILLEGAWSCTPFGQTPVKAAGGRLRSHRCDGFPPPSPKLLNDMSKGIEQLLPAPPPVKGGCYMAVWCNETYLLWNQSLNSLSEPVCCAQHCKVTWWILKTLNFLGFWQLFSLEGLNVVPMITRAGGAQIDHCLYKFLHCNFFFEWEVALRIESARNATSAILRHFFSVIFLTGVVNCDHQVGIHPIVNVTGYFLKSICKGCCTYYLVKE